MRARTMPRIAWILKASSLTCWAKTSKLEAKNHRTEKEKSRVRMDRTQRGWAIASLVILAVCAIAYVICATRSPQELRGGSAIGLVFGTIGFAFMIFAALLGARKRVPVWRLGRAQA